MPHPFVHVGNTIPLHRPAFEDIDTQTLFRRQLPKRQLGDTYLNDITQPTLM